MGPISEWRALIQEILLGACLAVTLAPRDAKAIPKTEYRKCAANAIAATLAKTDTATHEAITIAACYAAYKLEHKQASVSSIGQSFLDGMAPSEFLGAGSTSTLTFEFIDPDTGLPVSGPAVSSVRYEQSSTPDIEASFTLLGSSNDILHNFSLTFTATDTEVDIRAIPLDLSGVALIISGVDGFNVAEGDVVQLNAVPEPSTSVLFGLGGIGVFSWILRRVIAARVLGPPAQAGERDKT